MRLQRRQRRFQNWHGPHNSAFDPPKIISPKSIGIDRADVRKRRTGCGVTVEATRLDGRRRCAHEARIVAFPDVGQAESSGNSAISCFVQSCETAALRALFIRSYGSLWPDMCAEAALKPSQPRQRRRVRQPRHAFALTLRTVRDLAALDKWKGHLPQRSVALSAASRSITRTVRLGCSRCSVHAGLTDLELGVNHANRVRAERKVADMQRRFAARNSIDRHVRLRWVGNDPQLPFNLRLRRFFRCGALNALSGAIGDSETAAACAQAHAQGRLSRGGPRLCSVALERIKDVQCRANEHQHGCRPAAPFAGAGPGLRQPPGPCARGTRPDADRRTHHRTWQGLFSDRGPPLSHTSAGSRVDRRDVSAIG